MRLQFLLLISALLSCACNNHADEKLLQTFQPNQIYKSVSTRPFGFGKGLCGGSIWLNSDSTFTEEWGCEGRSHSIIGQWHVIGDSIELNPLKKNPKNISFNLSFSKTSADTNVTFIVFDKVNKPIQNFVINPFTQRPNYQYSDLGLLIVNGKYRTDSLGILKIKKSAADSLYFPKLYAFTGKDFAISTNHLPDTIKIGININGISFFEDQIKYDDVSKPMHYSYINDKLIFNK